VLSLVCLWTGVQRGLPATTLTVISWPLHRAMVQDAGAALTPAWGMGCCRSMTDESVTAIPVVGPHGPRAKASSVRKHWVCIPNISVSWVSKPFLCPFHFFNVLCCVSLLGRQLPYDESAVV
jgi:hypothetical protein